MRNLLLTALCVLCFLGNAFAGKLLDEVTNNNETDFKQDYKTSPSTEQHSNAPAQKGTSVYSSPMTSTGNGSLSKLPSGSASIPGNYSTGSRSYQ